MQEAGIRPDIVAGVSIGAFNGAVIASNPDRPGDALTAFWSDLAVRVNSTYGEEVRRWFATVQIALAGVPGLFSPRWLPPSLFESPYPGHWTSFHDLQLAIDLLEQYVDFSRLGTSPVRLIISAVDVETSELVSFDRYVHALSAKHVLASGSLPPSFSWTTVGGRHYWDGGIVSNSPLELVMDRCGPAGKRVFVVDLFSGTRRGLPDNLPAVMLRRDEILYAERLRNDLRTRDRERDFRRLVDAMLQELPPQVANRIRHRPQFMRLMGEEAPMTVTRIVRTSRRNETISSDFDFSDQSLKELISEGYRETKKVLSVNPDERHR